MDPGGLALRILQCCQRVARRTDPPISSRPTRTTSPRKTSSDSSPARPRRLPVLHPPHRRDRVLEASASQKPCAERAARVSCVCAQALSGATLDLRCGAGRLHHRSALGVRLHATVGRAVLFRDRHSYSNLERWEAVASLWVRTRQPAVAARIGRPAEREERPRHHAGDRCRNGPTRRPGSKRLSEPGPPTLWAAIAITFCRSTTADCWPCSAMFPARAARWRS